MKAARKPSFTQGAIALSVSLLFQSQASLAQQPTGAQVVNGTASMVQNGSALNITNSPGAIINWQSFSIGAGQATNFIQQSASSAVLNRVVGRDISSIQGQLLSNGRVFLINPAGIVIGPGAMIDTAGFIGSTLNMKDADFLAGKLRFVGEGGEGSIVNQGWIRTSYGGNVLLVAPRIENSGLIQTPGGELILAAGQKLTVASLEHEGVQFELQAPTDSVVNVGQLLASGGAVGVFAGSIKHSGDIRANALIRDEAGKVVLKASNDIQIAPGSNVSASGRTGGTVTIESGAGHSRVAGQVLATGTTGKGGGITITGERVTATDGALIDASGATGGGQILLGGDYQGANLAVRNATTTFVGPNAALRADATDSGDGGRIIVWGNENTRFFGTLSAQGGPQGGNGGFAEISGAQNLIVGDTASINLGASKGVLGNLLLDPLDLYVVNSGGVNSASGGLLTTSIVDETTDFPSNAITVSPTALAGFAGNVTLYASRYMRIGNDITLTRPGQSLTATVGTYTAPASPDPVAQDTVTPNRLDIGTDIATNKGVNIITNGGAVSLDAPLIQGLTTSKIATNGGAITLNSTGAIQASQLSLDAGAGAVQATSTGFQQLSAVTGGSFTATSGSSINIGGLITTTGGPVAISSTGSSISTSGGSTSGGAFTMTSTASSVNNFGTLTASGGAVSMTGTSVSGGTIDTSGTVALNATAGNINATINNSSGVIATSARSNNSTSININSSTVLNANSITATATNCFSTTSCPGATINLNATGDISVGAITANAPATTNNATVFNNSISRSVNLTSNGGSIRAQGPASLITATDVTLNTQQGSGGGIGTAAAPVNVDTERLLSLAPNGDFNVVGTGAGPTRFNAQMGVAATGKTYTGAVTRSGGGLTLNASATDTTVTVGNFAATGFTQRLYGQDPSIALNTPNGALTVTTMSVPEGDTRPTDLNTVFPRYFTAGLPVSVSASGALTINSYTRQNTAASFANSTSFSSSSGPVTLGTIDAGKDSVSVNSSGAAGAIAVNSILALGSVSINNSGGGINVNTINSTGSSISIGTSGVGSNVVVNNLTAPGGVSVSASGGDITVGRIDTTSGTGSVSLSASSTVGTVKAQTDSAALEVTSGGGISVSGKNIGDGNFTNPLDLAGSAITLTSNNATGGAIGFAGKAIIANTQNLTIDATRNTSAPTTLGATFNVNTGATALNSLTVSASPQAVGLGGPATVTTEGGVGNYNFTSDGTSFAFNAGTVSANQFVNGGLTFNANSGNVTLGAANLGATGGLSITARNGSILGGAGLDGGGAISLSAGQSVAGGAVGITVGDIGLINRPSSLTIASGNNGFSTNRTGTVTTGNIESGNVSVTTFKGNMTLGKIGATARAGAVALVSDQIGNVHGAVQTGSITAASLNISNFGNNVTTGNIDTTAGVIVTSQKTVTLGDVNATSLSVTTQACAICDQPLITTGAISGVDNLTLFGEAVTINGSVTGNPAGTGTLDIRAADAFFGGTGILNITGGSVTAGDGSTINLRALSGTPFQFKTISAGATGTVTVNANGGIQQIAPGGITAKTVNLIAENAAAPINQVGGDGMLDLMGTQSLGISAGGPVALDANGSILSTLSITKTATPGAAAFNLSNLGGGQAVSLTGGADLALTVNSAANPLNFSLNYSAGKAALAGGGVVTGGGNVNLSASGLLDATVGGINTSGGNVIVNSAGFSGGNIATGGPTGGGSVNISSNGTVTTGAINTTPTGTGVGGLISLAANAGGIFVNGNMTTGAGGGAISLDSRSAAIINAGGGATITSDTSVSIAASNGDIGSGIAPMLITSPQATLTSTNTGFGGGNVFATLTNTKSLTLSGDTGFNVVSNTAFDTVSVATRGTGLGAMTLTAPGQTYTFARPATDAFGGAVTNTFQVVAAAAPTASTTFTALDGDLLVGGAGTNIAATTLTLNANSGTGDVRIQGTAANPLTLNNTTQNIGSTSTRDVLIRGNVALTGTTTQNLTANRNITVQAEQGTVAISGADQSILSTGNSGAGTILFKGGAAANETVTVSASNKQLIQSPDNTTAAGVRIEGGDGAGSSAIVLYTGTGQQTVQAGGNVSVRGGLGANSLGEIRTATGSQFIASALNMDVTAGAGSGAAARIVNTGTANQQVGEARRSFNFLFPYQTDNITVAAGPDAVAEITAGGAQQVYTAGGKLQVLGGSGANTFARIETGTNTQQIGCISSFSSCNAAIGTLNLLAGTGVGAYSRILSGGQQNVSVNSAINLTASAAADASASLTGSGQTISSFANLTLTAGAGNGANALVQSSAAQSGQFSGITLTGGGGAGATATAQMNAAGTQSISGSTTKLTGGAGDNSIAQINSSGAQSLSFGNTTLGGGAGANSYAQLASTGASQSLNYSTLNMTGGLGAGSFTQIVAATTQNVSGGNMTLTGGGTPLAPVANTSALIQGNSQVISAGNLTLNGGNGTAGGGSDAVLRNLSGNQSVNANSVTLNGGAQFSTAGILNVSGGTQSVSGSNGILLTTIAGANNNTSVLIQNAPATKQTLTAANGGIGIINQGAGAASVTSVGTQQLTSRFVEVSTTAGSTGDAILSATGNQWIRTTDGSVTRTAPFNTTKQSMLVSALGTGKANIESGASQLIQLDYPDQFQAVRDGALTIGGTTAAGTSRIGAVDQTLFVKSLTVQTGTSGRSELKATNKQVVSVLNGNLNVLGGSGANTVSQIDPVDQTLLVNGNVNVQGGSGANAVSQIVSTGTQTIRTTNGGIAAIAGGGSALISATGNQSLEATGASSVIASAAAARIATAANQVFSFGSLNMMGGTGAGSVAEITAGGTQTLTGGNLILTGGGTAAAPVTNASAVIAGNSQTITATNLVLTGGNGTATGSSEVLIRNLSGDQNIGASGMTLDSGAQFSTTGIFNQGAGAQTIVGAGGIFLNTVLGANNNASVQIQNSAATLQTLSTSGGGLGLVNRGAGLVSISSGGEQSVTTPFVDIVTRTGTTGDAILSATGNQTIHTTNGTESSSGSLRVTAFGAGKANIESGANQTLNIDVPEQTLSPLVDGRLTVGDIAASGLSRIGAVNQTITSKTFLVQTGNTGSRSEVKSSGTQVIRVLNGNLDVRGGAGSNTLAQIDPIDQNIVVNGTINIVGGTGVNAIAQVVSAGVQNITANAINVTGGTGTGSLAAITALGLQTLNGNLVLTPNVGGAMVTGGTLASLGAMSGASSLNTGNVLSVQENQQYIIGAAEPDEQSEDNPIRRAPICF